MAYAGLADALQCHWPAAQFWVNKILKPHPTSNGAWLEFKGHLNTQNLDGFGSFEKQTNTLVSFVSPIWTPNLRNQSPLAEAAYKGHNHPCPSTFEAPPAFLAHACSGALKWLSHVAGRVV